MSVEDQYWELLRTLHCYLWKNSYEFQRFDAQMKFISKKQKAINKKQLAKKKKTNCKKQLAKSNNQKAIIKKQ